MSSSAVSLARAGEDGEKFADVKGRGYVEPALAMAAAGVHNVVTYFSNATNLRGTALRSGEPGGGRGIGVIAMLAGLLALRFRAQGIGRGLLVSSGELREVHDAARAASCQ